MGLETYHDPKGMNRGGSRNLRLLSSPNTAPYLLEFLSSPFYSYGTGPYGRPNCLFDALQIVFSHLVFNPKSEFANPTDFPYRLRSSRDDYDLSIVYLYNSPLRTIWYQKFSGEGESQEQSMELDLHGLLHVRNFWHGHLASVATSMYAQAPQTYGKMASTLAERGLAPQEWARAIQQSSSFPPRWYGHYSCTHVNPRKLMDIEEHQTCAEDWVNEFGSEGVHALTLDVTTTKLQQHGWWPPIFATVPILESTVPRVGSGGSCSLIRGIAPFLSPLNHPDMYPAYTSLRVRGVMHHLPDVQEIPGWNRIVMVLFKPTSQYLLNVLESSSDDDDSTLR